MKRHSQRGNLSRCSSGAAVSGYLHNKSFNLFGLVSVLALSCCFTATKTNAQLTILHSFADGTISNDGARPMAGLIQAPDGNFYGTTIDQIQSLYRGNGTVFRLTPGGMIEIVHYFVPGQHMAPSTALLYYNGDLLGATGGGGMGYGTVFRTKLSGKTVRWHVFNSQDGESPEASLILGSDGNLYGTTFGGGDGFAGVIFRLAPTIPHTYTILHSFSYSKGEGNNPDAALLQAKDGNYYGSTADSNSNDGGILFKITPAGKLTVIYHFSSNHESPTAPLIQASDGNFYGTTIGDTGGTTFKMTPNFVVSTLHTFGKGTDGYSPDGLVLGSNGNLYGVTTVGGTAGRGTIFELSTDGSSYSVLHNFGDGSVQNDGQIPNGPLVVGTDNNLYGTTEVGGSANLGTVFRMSP